MERRVVGVGRPEDALDFDDDEEPKCARRHEPLQALPPSFTVREDKVPDGELLLKPTWMQRRASGRKRRQYEGIGGAYTQGEGFVDEEDAGG